MSIDQTAAASSLRTLDELNKKANSNNLGQEDFLKIFVAQMMHQDPMEPAGHGEFLAQMAQFSLLEGFRTLSASFATSQAYSMIGKYVYIEDSKSPKPIFGKVDGVVNEKGVNYVLVGGELYSSLKVAGVMDPSSIESDIEAKILQGANLIGKTVTAQIKDEDGKDVTVTGPIEKLEVKDGRIFAVVGEHSIPVSSITQVE